MPLDGSQSAISVASSVDAAFLPMIEVVATSIAASASSGRPVDYHVFYDGPETWMTRRLEGWRRGVVRLHLHRQPNRWKHFGTVAGFPPSSLNRLSLPDVLADLRRVIYLDADLLVEADLGALFDTPLHGRPLGAARDRYVAELALRQGGRIKPFEAGMREYLGSVVGLHSATEILDYRQCGVLLMDLEALRNLDFAGRAAAVIEQHRDRLRFADQCAVNIVLKGNMAELDPRWNVLAHALSPESVAGALPEFRAYSRLQSEEPRILHFAGTKPWVRRGVVGGERWWSNVRAAGLEGYFTLRHLRERWRLGLRRLRRKPRSPAT